LRVEQPPNAPDPIFAMLLCFLNTTSTRWEQLKNTNSGMLSSLGQQERSTRRRERHWSKGLITPHPIVMRLGHLKESSMEPTERLLSFSLIFSAPERSRFLTSTSMINFWTEVTAEPVALFADMVDIACGRVKSVLLRITTVGKLASICHWKQDAFREVGN